MVEERLEGGEVSWRQLFSWTQLFRGFQVALDLNKLVLAAAGILTMAFLWWLLAIIFAAGQEPAAPGWPGAWKDWVEFRKARQHWNLMHEAANVGKTDPPPRYEVEDIAETEDEYKLFKDFNPKEKDEPPPFRSVEDAEKAIDEKVKDLRGEVARQYRAKAGQYIKLGRVKPAGRLSVGPWFEDRGPNPYLLATGQAGVPWEPGHFWEWFVRDQFLVMIEPLVKFVRPIIYFFSPRANDFWSRLYFFLVMLVTLLTWSVFGGAITRIAAVQVARGEKIGMLEALRFTLKRLWAYVTAPLFPLVGVLFLVIVMSFLGLIGMIPYFGDFLAGLFFWPILLGCGLLMAIALVGLVGWPLMSVTISAEGTDSWEAVSHSYSYVFQRPWSYAWYSLVAIAYGAVVVFFVGFMASLTVYLAKWGTARPALAVGADSREPSFLFVYAPTSFGWRELLLEGTVDREGRSVVEDRASRPPVGGPGAGGVNRWNRINPEAYDAYVSSLNGGKILGAWLVAFWLGFFFVLVLGFGYSYFWTASTIIYLLMRRSVDAAEMDEVYLEEEEQESPWAAPPAPPAPAKPTTSLPVVEAPPPPPPPPAPEPPAVEKAFERPANPLPPPEELPPLPP
jgi:hypothetical protein